MRFSCATARSALMRAALSFARHARSKNRFALKSGLPFFISSRPQPHAHTLARIP
jgi:hypothetical protein